MKKGIMFDMDNTLLRSNIQFGAMRQELIRFFCRQHIAAEDDFDTDSTPAQVIEKARQKNKVQNGAHIEQDIWRIVTEYEKEGMRDVEVEQGVPESLSELHREGYRLSVVTNNAYESACTALGNAGVERFFDLIVGRDQMQALKPSSSGIDYVIRRSTGVSRWLMIGDSWIDGRAAAASRLSAVDFVAFQSDMEQMRAKSVYPVHVVQSMPAFVHWVKEEWSDTDVHS
jgi:phosphoglycolate phosphatase